MFNIRNRFRSESKLEKLHGVLYIVLLLSIPVGIYLSVINYDNLNVNCFIGLGLYSWFLYTTLSGFLDYGDFKNSHNDSFEKYKAMINPSKGSWLYSWGKLETEQREKNKRNDEMGVTAGIFVLSVVATIVAVGFWIFGDNYIPFSLAGFNLFLVVMSLTFGGELINNLEVEAKQIEEINNVIDLSKKEKDHFKSYLKTKVDKNKKITRGDMDTVFKEIDILKKERELNEALKTESQADFRFAKKGEAV